MTTTRAASYKQEKRIAKQLGGKVVSNSGATAFQKGDVSHKCILVDGKTCMKAQSSVTIKKEWFDKISDEAFAMNKDFGVLAFDFGDDDIFYTVHEKHFKKLLKAYEEVNS